MMVLKKRLVIIFIVLLSLILISILLILGINFFVKSTAEKQLITLEKACEIEDIDCILVLGCGVRPDGSPSDMLKDRLEKSIELYKFSVSPKILMSGDHGQENYNEVGVMKEYAIQNGVPSSDVFMDHAGFSTYESLYRVKEIFDAKKIIIVTQKYHIYRALYIAEKLGLEAYGVSSDYRTYAVQSMRDLREILARNKDFITSIFKPKPKFLGDTIPVNGDGDITND